MFLQAFAVARTDLCQHFGHRNLRSHVALPSSPSDAANAAGTTFPFVLPENASMAPAVMRSDAARPTTIPAHGPVRGGRAGPPPFASRYVMPPAGL